MYTDIYEEANIRAQKIQRPARNRSGSSHLGSCSGQDRCSDRSVGFEERCNPLRGHPPPGRARAEGEEVSQRPAATLVWMREEDDQLRGAAVSGESIAAISKRLCRSEKAIWHRARKIGIELPQLRKKSGLLQAPSG